MERRLAAIMAVDVVGYARLIRADEEGTIAALKALRADLVGPKLSEHNGRIVKLMGDGMLAEFPSVVDAVRAAVETQQAMAEHNSGLPEDKRIEFRVGINLGDVVIDGDDIHGDGVNVAARLEGMAEPGGICISGMVYEGVRDRIDIPFEDMGEQEVKNIARPIRVWRWSEAVRAGPTVTGSKPLPLPDKPSIAVLPFENMSGDAEQEYFSDGISEDIITELSKFHELFVIARNSSFTYKGRAVDVKQIGRELGVRYVVEGSVRKAASRVRITAQLIDAASGSHIWADRYDGALDDIFDLQDDIATGVVGAIQPQLHRAEVERVRHKRPESLDAYDFALRGLAHMNELTPEGTAEGLKQFLKAIEADPGYARAYASASWCYRRKVQLHGMVLSDEDKARSIDLARAALKADSIDPYVLWQAGLTAAFVEGDFDAAVLYIDRSLSLNSNSTRAWMASGMVRCCIGDPETAIEHANRAIRLSPFDMAMWVAHGVLAIAHMQLADYEEAAAWARKSVRQHRYNLPAYHSLGASQAQLGRIDDARRTIESLLELDPALTLTRLEQIYPVAGYRNLDGYLEGLRKAGLPE